MKLVVRKKNFRLRVYTNPVPPKTNGAITLFNSYTPVRLEGRVFFFNILAF